MLDGRIILPMRASPATALTAALALTMALAAAPCGFAQTPSSSDPVSQPAMITPNQATSAASDSVDSQIAAWTAAPPAPAEGAGLVGQNSAPGPRQIHGEAGVGFGSNGYRQGYVTTEVPLGADSTLGLGVSETQFKIKNGPSVKDTSLALSLMVGNGDSDPGCQALRVNNQTVEPLWVTHLRGAPLGPNAQPCGQ